MCFSVHFQILSVGTMQKKTSSTKQSGGQFTPAPTSHSKYFSKIMKKNRQTRLILSIYLLAMLLLPLGVKATGSAVTAEQLRESRVTIDVRDTRLDDILLMINRQTNLSFGYQEGVIDKDRKFSLKVSEATVEETLNTLFSGTPYGYRISGNRIMIVLAASQQSGTVRGIVRDEGGSPLIGVNIIIKGTVTGTSTDVNGRFNLSHHNTPELTLTISYIGKVTQELRVSDKNILSGEKELVILLKDNLENLDEILVTGYQNIDVGRATGSYDIVDDRARNSVVGTDFVKQLEGIVPGLLVNPNGSMLIRGQSTIYAKSQPLIVVDGFPMEYNTFNINPNDIAQISVLKDAAAASIWGVRAANGVIVITTKNAKKNQSTTVTYSGDLKIGSKIDTGSMNFMTSAEQLDLELEIYQQGSTNNSWIKSQGGYYSEGYEPYFRFTENEITEEQMLDAYRKLGEYDNLRDVVKYFYRNSLLQKHNISVSGGGSNNTNYLSINYENDLAQVKGNEADNVGFQFNNQTDLFRFVRMSLGVRGRYSRQENNGNASIDMLPYIRFFNEDGSYANEYRSFSQRAKEGCEANGYKDWSYNRLRDRKYNDNKADSWHASANMKFDVTLPWNLSVALSGMYSFENRRNEQFYSQNSYYATNLVNQFTYRNPTTGELKYNLPEGGIKDLTNFMTTSYSMRGVLSYDLVHGDWLVTAQGGAEYFALRARAERGVSYGYDEMAMTYNSLFNVGELVNTGVYGFFPGVRQRLYSYGGSHSDMENRYVSFFATASGTFRNRYTLFGSIRYDKTNLYGRSARYRDQPTWSVGGKWTVSAEEFFKSSVVNHFALKASVGISGNIEKNTSPYLIAASSLDNISGYKVLSISNPANPDLGWEKTRTFNIGIETMTFSNKLSLSVEYYNKYSYDILGDEVMNPTSGWGKVRKNVASLSNRGVDLSISATPVKNANFVWSSTFAFSYNKNEVKKLNSGNPTVGNIQDYNPIEGQPIDYVWGYRYAGLDENGATQIVMGDGEVKTFRDITNFTLEDLHFLGRSTPPSFGSWTNYFSYKGIELDVVVSYKFGHRIRMTPIYFYTDWRSNNIEVDRWRESGDEERTWIPKADPRDYYSTQAVNNSDLRAEKGDIIRVRSIGLGYDFKNLIRTPIVKMLHLRFSVENPWKWVKNSENLDVDNLYNGNLPVYYTISLKATF